MTLIPENEDFALLIRETGVLAIKAKVFARVTIKSNTRKHFFILTRYETRISVGLYRRFHPAPRMATSAAPEAPELPVPFIASVGDRAQMESLQPKSAAKSESSSN